MKLPKHMISVFSTGRIFQKYKRHSLKITQYFFNQLMSGCYYSPAYKEICEVGKLLKIIKEKQSIKNWK